MAPDEHVVASGSLACTADSASQIHGIDPLSLVQSNGAFRAVG